jgi:pimeloyl-ACP methyl ester carboxylesterase
LKTILLLHGALGSKEQLNPLRELLKDDFNVFTLSFSGHGGNTVPHEKFSIELFAKDVLAFLENHHLISTSVFGYSMGGYVALYMARFFPEKMERIFTLATKFNWTPESAAHEAGMLEPEIMERKIPAFTQTLGLRHGAENWKKVVLKTAEMMRDMGHQNPLSADDFKKIKISVTLGLGDSDRMVSREEAELIQRLIAKSEMVIFKDTPHPIEKISMRMLADEIMLRFKTSDQ